MAFIISRNALEPRKLAGRVDPTAKIVRADDLDTLAQAEAFLEHARTQADSIVAGAQAAFDAECKRGYADGREQALMEQTEKMIEAVGRTVDYFASVENDMVRLVMDAVQKIVDDFDDEEKVMMAVRNALAVVRNQKQMTLRLNPAEVDVVRDKINDLLAAYPGVGYLDILADARLEKGACILESEIGMVEASLNGQLKALTKAFERTLGSRI